MENYEIERLASDMRGAWGAQLQGQLMALKVSVGILLSLWVLAVIAIVHTIRHW